MYFIIKKELYSVLIIKTFKHYIYQENQYYHGYKKI